MAYKASSEQGDPSLHKARPLARLLTRSKARCHCMTLLRLQVLPMKGVQILLVKAHQEMQKTGMVLQIDHLQWKEFSNWRMRTFRIKVFCYEAFNNTVQSLQAAGQLEDLDLRKTVLVSLEESIFAVRADYCSESCLASHEQPCYSPCLV